MKFYFHVMLHTSNETILSNEMNDFNRFVQSDLVHSGATYGKSTLDNDSRNPDWYDSILAISHSNLDTEHVLSEIHTF